MDTAQANGVTEAEDGASFDWAFASQYVMTTRTAFAAAKQALEVMWTLNSSLSHQHDTADVVSIRDQSLHSPHLLFLPRTHELDHPAGIPVPDGSCRALVDV